MHSLIRLAVVIGLLAADSLSAVYRYSLFIGNNEGLDGEKPLKYAASDAAAMGEFFRKNGRLPDDDVEILQNPGLTLLKMRLQRMAERIQIRKHAGHQAYLLIYFSGHGSAEALHIRGKSFTREEFWRAVGEIDGDLKVVILDACESGSFLREKGGRYLGEPHVFESVKLGSTGSISISASSQGELAQESEDYRGGVFTHHLLNGVRGLADYNRDLIVTVLEAFDYARTSTRKETIRGRTEQQSPAFDFDVVGSSDPELIRLGKSGTRVLFSGMPAGVLEIYSGNAYSLAARIALTGMDSVSYLLPKGKYIFVLGQGTEIRVREEDLTWSGETVLTPGKFQRKSYRAFHGKGRKILRVGLHGGRIFIADFSGGDLPRMGMVGVEYFLRKPESRSHLSMSFGQASDSGSTGLHVELKRLRIGLGWAVPVFRQSFANLHVGAEAAYNRLYQEAIDKRFAGRPVQGIGGPVGATITAEANLYEAETFLNLSFNLPKRFSLETSLAGGWLLLKDRASGKRNFSPTWTSGLALGRTF